MNLGLRVLSTAHSYIKAAWQMLEGSGLSVQDVSGYKNNLTLTSATWLGASSPLRNAVVLAGTGGMQSVSDANLNFNSNQPFSVSCWFNLSSATVEQTLIGHLDPSNNFIGWEINLNGFGIAGTARFLFINVFPSVQLNTYVSGLLSGNLYNIVVTYDGSATAAGVVIYLNGVPSSQTVLANNLSGSTQNAVPIFLGERSDGSNSLTGYVGPTFVWNRVLTSAEAASLFSNPYDPPK